VLVQRSRELQQSLLERFFLSRARSQGHDLCIYTTSLRSPFKIRLLFWAHGLSLNDVFNKVSHDRNIKRLHISSSKYPPMFGIDLHIDDSEGVKMEAQKFGFKVLILEESDLQWTQTVLGGVKNMEGSQK
jgi:hypothetical protein